ncbi:AI-2E family transporter [uncultured Faecalicoccus sp.]|uniref:AI-2E family transporter n=1 Tax=uncultured Faecalicoccus sp. TaxID=1971760 RepID=UPI0026265AE9|nr:AI-2E family transporter [uncultured Faecalicoccus sp.]
MNYNPKVLEAMIKRLILFTAVLILIIFNASLILDFLLRLISICYPFIFGAGLAFIFNIVSNGLMKYAVKIFHINDTTITRACTNIVSIFLVFSIVFGFIFLIIPQLLDSMQSIVDLMPNAINHLYAQLLEISKPIDSIHEALLDMQSTIGDMDKMAEMIPGFLGWVFSGGANGLFDSIYSALTTTFSIVASSCIALMFSFIVLFNKKTFMRETKALLKAYLPDRYYQKTIHVCSIVKRTFTSYIAGTSCECLILGTLVFLGCTIFGMPYALLTGIIVAIGAYVPMFGALVSAILCALFISVVDPMKGIYFIIMFICIQQVEGNFIYPNVVGKSVGLPPMYVIVAVTVGGSLAGILGMIIFIPICSCIYQLVGEDIKKRNKEKSLTRS